MTYAGAWVAVGAGAAVVVGEGASVGVGEGVAVAAPLVVAAVVVGVSIAPAPPIVGPHALSSSAPAASAVTRPAPALIPCPLADVPVVYIRRAVDCLGLPCPRCKHRA